MYKNNFEKNAARSKNTYKDRLDSCQETYFSAKKEKEIIDPLRFAIMAPKPVYGPAIHLHELVLPAGTKSPISFILNAGERIAIQGCNGSGKSTLLKVLSKQLPPVSGVVQIASSYVFLDQHWSFLNLEQTGLENFLHLAPGWTETQYRTALAQVRLGEERALLRADCLSGGERLKLALAILCFGPLAPSVMLLDEPDNHLDLESKELLESTLALYRGAMVLVSHDEDFLHNVGVKNFISLVIG